MKNFELRHILVPTDFSNLSMNAIDYALTLAKLKNAKITLVHIIEDIVDFAIPNDFVYYTEELIEKEKEIQEIKKDRLKKLAEKIQSSSGIEVNGVCSTGRSHIEIKKIAADLHADLIVMSTHGVSGFREFIIGSNTVRVISEAECPVLSVQQKMKSPGFKKILLQFRDEPHSREKVNYGIKLAQWFDSELSILAIDTMDTDEHRRKMELEAQQIKSILDEHQIRSTVEVRSTGNVAKLVQNYAEEINADLILLMSSMDKANISEYIMGPVAQQIINHSKIPVMSIRPTFNPNTINLHPYGW